MLKPAKLHLEDILTAIELQKRVYRLRCLEAWSMVYNGYSEQVAHLYKGIDLKRNY